MNRSTPGFCRPMALSMPAGVSQTRGGGLPGQATGATPLVTTAPQISGEKNGRYSRPYP